MTNRTAGLVGIAAVLLLALAAWLVWRGPDDPARADPVVVRVDSQLVAERAGQRVRDSLAAIAHAAQRQADSAAAVQSARVARLTTQAQALAAQAAQLAAVARAQGDTLSAAWSAYQVEHMRSDSLSAALAVTDSARVAAVALAAKWRAAYDSANASVARYAAIARDLREAVDRAAERDRCRLGPFGCPSRTAVAVVGVVAGAAGAAYLNKD